MACRVGMSTDPVGRIQHWKNKEGHTGSRILATDLTYSEAIIREKQEAKNRGCKYGPGGEHKSGRVWSVYHLWGGI